MSNKNKTQQIFRRKDWIYTKLYSKRGSLNFWNIVPLKKKLLKINIQLYPYLTIRALYSQEYLCVEDQNKINKSNNHSFIVLIITIKDVECAFRDSLNLFYNLLISKLYIYIHN